MAPVWSILPSTYDFLYFGSLHTALWLPKGSIIQGLHYLLILSSFLCLFPYPEQILWPVTVTNLLHIPNSWTLAPSAILTWQNINFKLRSLIYACSWTANYNYGNSHTHAPRHIQCRIISPLVLRSTLVSWSHCKSSTQGLLWQFSPFTQFHLCF